MADGASGLRLADVGTVVDVSGLKQVALVHEFFRVGRAWVYRPFGPFAFFCSRNRGLRPRQRMYQPFGLKTGRSCSEYK